MGCTTSKNRNRYRKGKAKGTTATDSSYLSSSVSRSVVEENRCYVALWDYKKASNAELSFVKGNLFMEVVEECDAGPEWIFVTQDKAGSGHGRPKAGEESKRPMTGYVPRNFVAIRGTLDAEPYWFGNINRHKADVTLQGTTPGTFLLRSRAGGEFLPQFALSVNCGEKVKHFKIHCNQNQELPRYTFAGRSAPDVRLLIGKFKEEQCRAIGCLLRDSPPRPAPKQIVLSAEVEKNWREIPRRQILIEKEIGKGFYGVVHRGFWEPEPGVKLQVAIKELKKGVTEGRVNFVAEAVTMKNLRHPRLVKLLGVVSADEPFYIITEYIKQGSLLNYLQWRERHSRLLEEPLLVNIACQVSEGMRYLEEKKVIHRDLAARNVLIQEGEAIKREKGPPIETFDVKIADFGLAQMVKAGSGFLKEKRAINLPTKWLAPEALTEGKFSCASDVWSFGILLYEIFTHGKEPYPGMSTTETKKFVLEERKQLARPAEMPEGIHNLLVSCCEYNPLSRPMFQHIHCFLQSFYDKDSYYRYFDEKKV